MKPNDVEKLNDKRFLVKINDNKNNYPGQFMIGALFYDKVDKYISLRPTDEVPDRFFIKYKNGTCFSQPIGRHTIGQVPSIIATCLNLENPKGYTGHSFRRSSATLLSESGATMQQIKQLGRWRSDLIAAGYIENSINNREVIYNGIINESKKNKNSSLEIKSCSATNYNNQQSFNQNANNQHISSTNITTTSSGIVNFSKNGNVIEGKDEFNLNWADFDDDFIVPKQVENTSTYKKIKLK